MKQIEIAWAENCRLRAEARKLFDAGQDAIGGDVWSKAQDVLDTAILAQFKKLNYHWSIEPNGTLVCTLENGEQLKQERRNP